MELKQWNLRFSLQVCFNSLVIPWSFGAPVDSYSLFSREIISCDKPMSQRSCSVCWKIDSKLTECLFLQKAHTGSVHETSLRWMIVCSAAFAGRQWASRAGRNKLSYVHEFKNERRNQQLSWSWKRSSLSLAALCLWKHMGSSVQQVNCIPVGHWAPLGAGIAFREDKGNWG